MVAENAKRLREEKRLTLDEAARLTGVSRSMLAQIEKGDVNPTISMVWKIANGYRVSFTSLVEPVRQRPVLLRAADAPALEEDGGRYRNYPAFPFDEERGFETYRIVIQPGAESPEILSYLQEQNLPYIEGCLLVGMRLYPRKKQ